MNKQTTTHGDDAMYGIQYPLPPKGVPLMRVASQGSNFNWGVPQPGELLVWSCDDVVSTLSNARLSELDIAALEGLRLGSEYADCERNSFAELMQGLGRHLICTDEVIGVMEVWLQELFTYLPPFCFDSEADDLIKGEVLSDATARYLDRGFGAPLTALYLLTLRSNYWQEQFYNYSGGIELIEPILERKAPEAAGFTFAEILGDPFTSPSTSEWSYGQRSDFFLVREDFVHTYLAVGQPDGRRDDLRAITEAMLLLNSIAAQYIGGRLKEYIQEYEAWLNEYVLAENGGSYPAHMK